MNKKCIGCEKLLIANQKKFCSKSCNGRYNKHREASRTHDMSSTHFYKTWSNINYRCNNSNDRRYHDYGGRGIKVEWKTFEEFKLDMYESYQSHLKEFGRLNTTIDRIDVNGNYSKDNCRWATQKVQQRNRSNNKYYTLNGRTQCLFAWAEEFNITPKTLWWRLNNNWELDKVLLTVTKQ